MKYLECLIGEDADSELRTTYLESGPVALAYLAERSEVKFGPAGDHPDYQINKPGAAFSGRVVIPLPFDGQLLGHDFARVRPPIDEFMLLGGMMVGKSDIPCLLGRFRSLPKSCSFSKPRGALSGRPLPLSTRNALGHGKRARGAALC